MSVDVNATRGLVSLSYTGPFVSHLSLNGTNSTVNAQLQALFYRAPSSFEGTDSVLVTATRKTQVTTALQFVNVTAYPLSLSTLPTYAAYDAETEIAVPSNFTTFGMCSLSVVCFH